MFRRPRAPLLALWPLMASCAASEPAAKTPTTVEPVAGAAMITPSALVPVLGHDVDAWYQREGHKEFIIGGMRVVIDDEGRVTRASERFPAGTVEALPMPARLGGGYLFYQADSQGTRLWRAETWVSELKPLTFIGPTAAEVFPGFDRLYIRTRDGQVVALDAEAGDVMPLGPLPLASAYGAMVFADGWRAIVDSDIRGLLATFDAGASWRPLPIDQPVLSAMVNDGDPVLYVAEGQYRLEADGQLQLLRYDEADAGFAGDGSAAADEKRPFGRDPLRIAIAHGVPIDRTHAVVAHGGGLGRVRLPDGVVEAYKPDLLEDDAADCTGVQVGEGIGFVCGVEDGPTVIYAYAQPLSVREVARFEEPRFVSSSGNGAFVVRGKCEEDAQAGDDMRVYCVIDKSGERREIAVRGELGAERVVALDDGRVVVLVPPRLGRPGRLTVIAGDDLSSHELSYLEEPPRAVKTARRGMWLEGFQQRGKGRVAGWVEAGGPVVGVSVAVDSGEVQVGELREEGTQALLAGPFGLVATDAGTAFESVDGGVTWKELDVPELPADERADRKRGCTPVGCILRGWLRIGWGEPEQSKDLRVAELPDSSVVTPVLREPVKMRCALRQPPQDLATHRPVGDRAPFSGWHMFRGASPPRLDKGEIGVDKASQYTDDTPSHVYVWGPKGADWSKAGWWQIRFDDRFRANGVVSSAPGRSPWADEVTASEAIGARHRAGYWRWHAEMDPSGQAAVANLCMGSRCLPYAVAAGEPIVQYRSTTATPSYRRPLPHGVARVGEEWFFLSEEPGGRQLTLWRGRLGIMEPAARINRLDRSRYPSSAAAPRLVRSALGQELGLLVTVPPDPASGSSVGAWMVVPLEADRATLGEPILLGPTDFDGTLPRACEEHDRGWLIETQLPSQPVVQLEGVQSGTLSDVELRLRLDAGSACVEAIAARVGKAMSGEGRAGGTQGGVPLAVRERYTGRRWTFSCEPLP